MRNKRYLYENINKIEDTTLPAAKYGALTIISMSNISVEKSQSGNRGAKNPTKRKVGPNDIQKYISQNIENTVMFRTYSVSCS